MTDLQKAIQEFEDEAYHKRLHPEISDQSKTVALATMIEKQKLMSNGLTSQLLVEISRAAGDLHTSLFCRTCGDGLDLELVDGELAIYLPGDIMYVRETWAKYKELDSARTVWLYKADEPRKTIYEADGMTLSQDQQIKWRPSIHMPKEAARIFLRALSVNAERLHDITDADVLAEGTPDSGSPAANLGYFSDNVWDDTVKPAELSIYGWKANPWVWVVRFEKIERYHAAWDPILKTFCRIAPNDNKEAV